MGADTEKLKHTCPACGQPIEYTIDDSGQQIDCPSCQKPVLLPAAIGAAAARKTQLQKNQIRRESPNAKKPVPGFASTRKVIEFQYWKVVGICLVPFLIIGGLLYGAAYLRKASANDTVEIPKAITTPVAGDGWKKMTEMAQVEGAIKSQIQQTRELKQILQVENAQMQQYQNNSANASLMQQQKEDLSKKMEAQQNQVNALHTAFYQTMDLYRKMGGTIDYNSQFPN
jgi:hypothetical protein